MINVCKCCKKGQLKIVDDFSVFGLVTSDCRLWRQPASLGFCLKCGLIQRPNERLWMEECEDIYGSYIPYPLGNNSEPRKFDQMTEGFEKRSVTVLRNFKEQYLREGVRNWLDFGCGDGQLLQNVQEEFPSLGLFGVDFGEKYRNQIEETSGATLLSRLPSRSQTFDIVSMFHVVEHLPDPVKDLKTIGETLSRRGLLLIQVPNHEENPFDLVIFDHGSFFSKRTLELLLNKAGYIVWKIHKDWIRKELTAICEYHGDGIHPDGQQEETEPVQLQQILEAHKGYLCDVIREAEEKLKKHKTIKVFGSSIAACWLVGEIGLENIECFLDQDDSKWGSKLFGKDIREPGSDNLSEVVIPADRETKLQVINTVFCSPDHSKQ